MAGGDEIDYGADKGFPRLDGWWVDVGRVESVEEGCVPKLMSDARRKGG